MARVCLPCFDARSEPGGKSEPPNHHTIVLEPSCEEKDLHHQLTRRALIIGSLSIVRVAHAESAKVWRVAFVTSGVGRFILDVIRETFKSKGYEEGRNLIIYVREANGRYDTLPALLDELIALKPDLIIAEATPAVAAAQRATATIPIVMAPASDPIGSGFVKSFTHPGGNITGVANMFGDATTKTLDIIRQVFPKAKKIGVLISNNPTHPAFADVAERAARAVGISASRFVAPNPEDLERVFSEMKAAGCQAVYVLADPPRPALPPIALRAGLATIFQVSSYVTLYDGLISYGPNIRAFFTKAVEYADRIIKGARPEDLPVEQPTTFEFIINLRTARALGLTIPENVLLMADRVIE
jgi:putative tryptophan/tyrosine transport system substrate-binding protein